MHEGGEWCPICYIASDHLTGSDPISLRLGEKREEVTDLVIHTANRQLSFTRTYRQSEQDTYQFMGLGWNHDKRIALTFPDSDTIVAQLPRGKAHFVRVGSTDTFQGEPGSLSVIVHDTTANDYTLTASDTSVYTFDSSGKLLSQVFPGRGHLDVQLHGRQANVRHG